MCIKVRLFASYREAAGTARLEAPLPAGARVSDLLEMLAINLPALLVEHLHRLLDRGG